MLCCAILYGAVLLCDGRHQLTQPEGTWCFWAPEICTTSSVAEERAMQAAMKRAKGADAAKAAKAMAWGGGGVGSSSAETIKVGGW